MAGLPIELTLVSVLLGTTGYKRLSFTRADSVVNCQSALVLLAFWMSLPGGDFSHEGFLVGDTAGEALAGEDGEFGFGSVRAMSHA